MTDAKRLLAEATPLPWSTAGYDKEDEGHPVYGGVERHSIDEGLVAWVTEMFGIERSGADAALIVYAVNHLPDYEAAAEALRRMVSVADTFTDMSEAEKAALDEARAALYRLHDEVPA